MTQKNWSTADVSAYLDGALAPEAQVAFETAVSQDPDLRRRVTDMQQVVALLRSVPLKEPPRNYLVTPAMVAERKPRRRRLRLPLVLMRVATSAAAAAFAITSGLALMQQGVAPTMVTRSGERPDTVVMLESEELGGVPESGEAPLAHVARNTAVVSSEAVEEPEGERTMEFAAAEAEKPVEEAAAAVAEAPEDAAEAPPGEELGVGGGGEPPEPAVHATVAEDAAAEDDVTKAPAPVAEVEPAELEAPRQPDIDADDSVASEPLDGASKALSPEGDLSYAEEGAPDAESETPSPTMATRPSVPSWMPISLGFVTAALAAITFWLSRRSVS